MALLSPANTQMYEAFLAWSKNRISKEAFVSLKSISYLVLQWFDQKNIPLESATIQDIIRFKQDISKRHGKTGKLFATGTLCNYIKGGKRLFRFLFDQELITKNPFAEIDYPRLPFHVSRNVLTETQMHHLLEVLSHFEQCTTRKKRLEMYRTHVLAEFLYATGVRISEAARLEVKDFSLYRRQVAIISSKHGVSRQSFLTVYAASVLARYFTYGRALLLGSAGRKSHNKVFGVGSATLAYGTNKVLRKVCTTERLPVITCHGFRHSLGAHLLRSGCDIRYIQDILGHKNLNSTQVYTQVDKEDLKNCLDTYHPRKDVRYIAV
jgi:integrase/recombinase XerD